MDAKHIAALIAQVADLAHAGTITLEMNTSLNASLWELATVKGLREEVAAIIQEEVQSLFQQ
jgi:hypothetical protein